VVDDGLMGRAEQVQVEAAGGVLWRAVDHPPGVEVALVHRPKYDDWSIPKGKLDPGEHYLLAAVREVREETGFDAVPGRPLGELRYLKDAALKRVRYWAMEAGGGRFTPTAEVDQLMWLPPREAQLHLEADRDRPVLERFARDPRPTRPLVLVRHGSAGDRTAWSGEDRARPLDDVGHAQADVLARILELYRVKRVASADVLRCMDTLAPFASAQGLSIETEPLFSETGFETHPDRAVDRLLELAADPTPIAVCSQGGVIDELAVQACERLGLRLSERPHVRKGGLAVIHLTRAVEPEAVAVEVHGRVA
jgi:8-oxo-(d)GTP phosphatase